MTYEQLIQLMEDMHIVYAYDHFSEGESPDPPFLVFLIPGTDHFSADGMAYVKINEVHIELYTNFKQPNIERQVEAVLDQHGLFYSKSEVWIQEERLYETLYIMEVIDNGK